MFDVYSYDLGDLSTISGLTRVPRIEEFTTLTSFTRRMPHQLVVVAVIVLVVATVVVVRSKPLSVTEHVLVMKCVQR